MREITYNIKLNEKWQNINLLNPEIHGINRRPWTKSPGLSPWRWQSPNCGEMWTNRGKLLLTWYGQLLSFLSPFSSSNKWHLPSKRSSHLSPLPFLPVDGWLHLWNNPDTLCPPTRWRDSGCWVRGCGLWTVALWTKWHLPHIAAPNIVEGHKVCVALTISNILTNWKENTSKYKTKDLLWILNNKQNITQ